MILYKNFLIATACLLTLQLYPMATPRGLTPLHTAAIQGNISQVQALITAHANVNAQTNEGWTPLHYAAEHGHCKIVELLVKAGANKEARLYASNERPLHLAAAKGHTEVVATLIKTGAAKEAMKKFTRETPLLLATKNNHTETARILIESGANPNAWQVWENWQVRHNSPGSCHINWDCNEYNLAQPLHFAAQNGNTEIVCMLIATGANNKSTIYSLTGPLVGYWPDGSTPLHLALINGHTEIARILITSGAPIYRETLDGATPLEYAIRYNQQNIIKILVAAGANKYETARARLGYISHLPLLTAARYGNIDAAKILIAAGADLDARDSTGDQPYITPLHRATEEGHIEFVKFLITIGANIEAIHLLDGSTPLHIAAKKEYIKIVQMLVTAGANINEKILFRGWSGMRILTTPRHTKSKEIIAYLDSLPKLAAQLKVAVDRQDLTGTKELLAQGAPIFTPGLPEDTPVHKSIKAYNRTEPSPYDLIAKELIRASGYRVAAARNQLGQTPLHIAAIQGNLWIAQYLLHHRADVNAQDGAGNTPLHLASTAHMRDRLLRHRADVSIVNHDGQNPIVYNINPWMSLF